MTPSAVRYVPPSASSSGEGIRFCREGAAVLAVEGADAGADLAHGLCKRLALVGRGAGLGLKV